MLVSILSTSYDVPGILPRYCYYPFSVVILLFCSQESHIPEDALLGENLERSLKFGFERFGETLIFFCSQGLCAAVGGERKLEIIIIITIYN